MIPVIPKPLAPKFIQYVDMYATELRLNEYVVFCVSLFDNSNQLIQREYVRIEGDEYKSWGEDDMYIKKVVASKFGLEFYEPQPEPQPQLEPQPQPEPQSQLEPQN